MLLKKIKCQIKSILNNKLYKLIYRLNLYSAKWKQRLKENESYQYDLVFVVNEANKGWILDAICKEIAKNFSEKSIIFYWQNKKTKLPKARIYFFSHYLLLFYCLRCNPFLFNYKIFIFYTHPSNLIKDDKFNYFISKVTQVISMCSYYQKKMIECGLNKEKVTFSIGGAADPQIFLPHKRNNRVIGFCSAYYPRKNPEIIIKIIDLMPHRDFILLGKEWDKYENFLYLLEKENFEYYNVPYKEYYHYYKKMDILVSPSKVEGGPIPLIEAMMCNVFPIASKTGFAPDLIQHRYNGFLFDIDAEAKFIVRLIEEAFSMKTNVRDTVIHLTWDNFSLEMNQIIKQFS